MPESRLLEVDDYGNLDDLQARLESLCEDGDRRLVTLFGSGLSNTVVPDISRMTQIFRSYMPARSQSSFDEMIKPIEGSGLAYQNAASLLKRQRGDATLARAIRDGVLHACLDVPQNDRREIARDLNKCTTLEKDAEWRIPIGYSNFATYLSTIPDHLRGPVLTTNFDPLLEIALRQAGFDVSTVPVPLDSAPTGEQIQGHHGLPIIHLHGHWTSNSTLSTIGQLTKIRPNLHGLLRSLLRRSITLVVAYSGWRDAFMMSLKERIAESELLEAEILWCAYEHTDSVVNENSILDSLRNQPGFTLYLGIDGNKAFDIPAGPDDGLTSHSGLVAPYGYSHLPIQLVPKTRSSVTFVDGQQPTWKDAAEDVWPWLNSTVELHRNLEKLLQRDGGGGVLALGPMGEGKSLALMQVASRLAETSDWHVLWREPGAPPPDALWFEKTRENYGKAIICIDEADLVAPELMTTKYIWGAESSGIALLLASQDRLWPYHDGRFQGRISSTQFHGLTDADADAIATAWERQGILSTDILDKDAVIAKTAADLLQSSKAMLDGKEATLFGAILDVRFGAGLTDRVHDLLQKFRNIKIRSDQDTTLADIYQAICLMQDTYDRYGQYRRGASRPLVAAMVGLETVFVDGRILELLGREAAVTYAADRIYSRHPAIARTVVNLLRAEGTILNAARLVGHAGASLRATGSLAEADYRDAYMLAKELRSPHEAISAAEGALTAAPELLEPRVTYLSILRKYETLQATRYAAALAKHVRGYKDFGAAIRAFLVEASHVTSTTGAEQLAVGLSALALHDGIGFYLDQRRAQYALVRLAKSAVGLRTQSSSATPGLIAAAVVALERLIGVDTASRFLLSVQRSASEDGLDATRKLSGNSLCMRIVSQCSPFTKLAINEIGLDIEDTVDRISLTDLQRLISVDSAR